MTSYLEEQLKSIEQNKIDLEKEQLKIQKQLELEIEKVRILELDGTIDKLKVQVNELSENINGKIIPNNIQLVHHQMKQDFQKDLDEFHQLRQSRKLDAIELETKRLIVEQKGMDLRKETEYNKCRRSVNGIIILPDDEKLITLDQFKNNLSKIDDETKNNFTRKKEFLEIKPEIKVYDDILPIFRTMIGIITKQQEEINILTNFLGLE